MGNNPHGQDSPSGTGLSNPVLKAALSYLARGYAPIPLHWPLPDGRCSCGTDCDKAGKHPLVEWKAYQKQQPTDGEVRGWWRKWPRANIGLVTAGPGGLVAHPLGPSAEEEGEV